MEMAAMSGANSQTALMKKENFTDAQLKNFESAFNIFDVNHDGKISTEEIFQVLADMGNTVSDARRRKIKDAVRHVDVDLSGDLDFDEFIQFMAIMQEYNEADQIEDSGPWCYGNIMHIQVVRTEPEKRSCCRKFMDYLARFVLALNLLYALAISVGVVAKQVFDMDYDFNDQIPANDDSENKYGEYVMYVRLLNVFNIVWVLMILGKYRQSHNIMSEDMDQWYDRFHYRETRANFFTFYTRHILVLNTVASVFFLVGIPEYQKINKVYLIEAKWRIIKEAWKEALPPFIQAASTYFFMSYYWVFDTVYAPARFLDIVLIFLGDLLVLNWVRLLVSLVVNLIGLILLPFQMLVYAFLACAMACCSGPFDLSDSQSLTHKLFYFSERLSVEQFTRRIAKTFCRPCHRKSGFAQ